MGRLDHNGVLNDYTCGQMDRLAFDHALRTNHEPRAVTVDAALRIAREQRAAADQALLPMAKLIKGYSRLR